MIISLTPLIYAPTYFSDNFESEAISTAKWTGTCTNTWDASGLSITGIETFEGSGALLNRDEAVVPDTNPLYTNITLDTSLTAYTIIGYIYDNVSQTTFANNVISLDTTSDRCDTGYNIIMGLHYTNTVNYSYVYSGIGWTVTNIARSTNTWHKITMLIYAVNSTYDGIKGYIDDIELFTYERVTTYEYSLGLGTPRFGTYVNLYDLVTITSGAAPSGEDWEIDDFELPIGGIPDNSTDEIDAIFGNECDYNINVCPNLNNTDIPGITNDTDDDIFDWNFTSNPQTFFYMFSTPRLNNTDLARANRLSIILGDNYTGTMSLTFYVASNLESRKFQPISDNNPAYLVKSRSWTNPVKGMYWVDLDSYTLVYGQVFALAVSGDSAGLVINETNNLNPMYQVEGYRPFTIVSNYNLFKQDSLIAIWIELIYQIIIDESGTQGDEGQQITSAVPIGEWSLMQSLIYFRGNLGMGDMAGGIFIGLMLTMIFIFLTALIGARMSQQIPSLVYILMFVIVTTLNTVLGFYPVYTMVLVIFIVAILTASTLRNLQSGGGGM